MITKEIWYNPHSRIYFTYASFFWKHLTPKVEGSRFFYWGGSAKRANPIWVPKIVPAICLDSPYGTNRKDSRGTINQPTLLNFIFCSALYIYFFSLLSCTRKYGLYDNNTTMHRLQHRVPEFFTEKSPAVRELRAGKDWQWWRGFGAIQPKAMLHVFIIWRLHLLVIKRRWSSSVLCTIVKKERGTWIIKFFNFGEKTRNLSLTWFHLNSSSLLQGNSLKDLCSFAQTKNNLQVLTSKILGLESHRGVGWCKLQGGSSNHMNWMSPEPQEPRIEYAK